jgi:hypothetical protein
MRRESPSAPTLTCKELVPTGTPVGGAERVQRVAARKAQERIGHQLDASVHGQQSMHVRSANGH